MKRALSMTLCLGFTLTGCASTRVSPQTEKLVADLKCEMTMGDVERLAQSKLRPQGQRPWGTHILKQGTTDIWLQFDGDKLQYFQISTLDGLMRMKLSPRSLLCGRKARP